MMRKSVSLCAKIWYLYPHFSCMRCEKIISLQVWVDSLYLHFLGYLQHRIHETFPFCECVGHFSSTYEIMLELLFCSFQTIFAANQKVGYQSLICNDIQKNIICKLIERKFLTLFQISSFVCLSCMKNQCDFPGAEFYLYSYKRRFGIHPWIKQNQLCSNVLNKKLPQFFWLVGQT